MSLRPDQYLAQLEASLRQLLELDRHAREQGRPISGLFDDRRAAEWDRQIAQLRQTLVQRPDGWRP